VAQYNIASFPRQICTQVSPGKCREPQCYHWCDCPVTFGSILSRIGTRRE